MFRLCRGISARGLKPLSVAHSISVSGPSEVQHSSSLACPTINMCQTSRFISDSTEMFIPRYEAPTDDVSDEDVIAYAESLQAERNHDLLACLRMDILKLSRKMPPAVYGIVIRSALYKRDFVHVLAMIEKATRQEIVLETFIYTIVATNLASNADVEGIRKLIKLIEPITRVTPAFFESLMVAYLRTNDRARAQHVLLVEVGEAGLLASDEMVLLMLKRLQREATLHEFKRVLEKFESRMESRSVTIAYSLMVEWYLTRHKTADVISVLTSMLDSNRGLDAAVVDVVIKYCSDNNDFVGAKKVFDTVYSRKAGKPQSPPSIKAVTLVLQGTLRNKPLDAIEFFKYLPSYGFVTGVQTMNVFLQHYAETADLDGLRMVLHFMYKYQIKADAVTVTSVIFALARSGDPARVRQMLDSLLSMKIKPTVISYTAAARAYCILGVPALAEELIDEMRTVKIYPNVITYTTIIQAYASAGKLFDAFRLKGLMEQRTVRPTEVTYKVILRACIEQREPLVMGPMLVEMKEKGINVDEKFVTACLTLLNRISNTDMLRDLSKTFGYNPVSRMKINNNMDLFVKVKAGNDEDIANFKKKYSYENTSASLRSRPQNPDNANNATETFSMDPLASVVQFRMEDYIEDPTEDLGIMNDDFFKESVIEKKYSHSLNDWSSSESNRAEDMNIHADIKPFGSENNFNTTPTPKTSSPFVPSLSNITSKSEAPVARQEEAEANEFRLPKAKISQTPVGYNPSGIKGINTLFSEAVASGRGKMKK